MQEVRLAEFNYGGQAVMEGVMMRGRRVMAVAVRTADGRIVVHSEPLNHFVYNGWPARIPLVRGITLIWDTLVLGIRTLMYSAEVVAQGMVTKAEEEGERLLTAPIAWGTVLVSVGLVVGLFFLLPAFLTRLLDRYIANDLVSNLIEGLIRLALVLGYIWGVGFLSDVRRVFAYHGAEHKTVHAYEAGDPLTVEGVRPHSIRHARCGTAFILVVVVISVLVFALLGRPPLLVRLASRIVLLPLIVGVAYEWLRLGARYGDRLWMKALVAPGLLVQRLTTREPDDGMIEVAIAALRRVLSEEGEL